MPKTHFTFHEGHRRGQSPEGWAPVLLCWCTSPWECLWRSFLHTSPEPANTAWKHQQGKPSPQQSQLCTWEQLGGWKTSPTHSILATLDGVCLCGGEEREEGEWCGAVWKHLYKYVHFRFIFTSGMYSTTTDCLVLFFPHCSFGFLWNHQFADFYPSS